MGFPGRRLNQVNQESPSFFPPKQPKRTPMVKTRLLLGSWTEGHKASPFQGGGIFDLGERQHPAALASGARASEKPFSGMSFGDVRRTPVKLTFKLVLVVYMHPSRQNPYLKFDFDLGGVSTKRYGPPKWVGFLLIPFHNPQQPLKEGHHKK